MNKDSDNLAEIIPKADHDQYLRATANVRRSWCAIRARIEQFDVAQQEHVLQLMALKDEYAQATELSAKLAENIRRSYTLDIAAFQYAPSLGLLVRVKGQEPDGNSPRPVCGPDDGLVAGSTDDGQHLDRKRGGGGRGGSGVRRGRKQGNKRRNANT